jgi:uncharacterized protein YdhG (YjbR/CyaY superfamily)
MKEVTPDTIDQYIDQQSELVKDKLIKIRDIISRTVPDATESISYRMPLFKYHGMLAYFAAFTNHYSIFLRPPVMNTFKPHLKDYNLSKSGWKIPNSMPVPEKLLTEIIKYAAQYNLAQAEIKKEASKKKK